ncbi:MAG: hypothetical protein WCA35_02260 [Kovacikia sp.]
MKSNQVAVLIALVAANLVPIYALSGSFSEKQTFTHRRSQDTRFRGLTRFTLK